MSHTCSCCGKELSGLPRFFLLRRLDEFANSADLTYDEEYACRHGTGKYFVRCELELPIERSEKDVLGFVSWAEVPELTYVSYLAYRMHAAALADFEETIEGRLANEIPRIPGSIGTPIVIRALPRDPTPYIRWVQPGTSLAARLAEGATTEYWHGVAAGW